MFTVTSAYAVAVAADASTSAVAVATDADIIYPRRLVFISMGDNCMFCPNPKGHAYLQYVYLPDKLGYIYCGNCDVEAKKAVKFWEDHIAYGKVRYLKDALDIKIMRTNGQVEGGWAIDGPLIGINEETGKEKIRCYNEAQQLTRWCYVEDLIEYNPPVPRLPE